MQWPRSILLASLALPRLDGRLLVFCANIPWQGKLVRVSVHADTLEVTQETLGAGVFEMAPYGRDYRSAAGQVRCRLVEGPVTPWPLAAPPGAHEALAQAWRDAGRSEHASIASFARASAELMAVGAPLDLVRRMHEAALDEVRHAQFSFSIAAALDGRALVAGPIEALAPREASLARVALDTLTEAAIPETLAAAEAQAAAAEAVDPALAAVLRGIAEDEARHASLAWEILGWCLPRCSVAERAALSQAQPPSLAPSGLVPPGYGSLGPAGRAAVTGRTWREQIAPRLAQMKA